MLNAAICDMLGIKYPVFQGGMAHIADARLAAAVSNGGGLGIISAMNRDAEYLKEQIQLARELTDKPFGVNVMLMSPYTDEVAQLLAKERVSVITTGAGNPSKYMEMWLSAGIKVFPVVASTALAKIVERCGASAVIAEGVRYLHIEGTFYLGIGWLFLLYGLYRAVGRPGMSVVLTVISLGTRVALAYALSAVPAIGVVGIWWSVPIGWFLADAVGLGYYWRKRRTVFEMK